MVSVDIELLALEVVDEIRSVHVLLKNNYKLEEQALRP